VRDELAKNGAKNGVIFDGVVRTIPQAQGVEKLLGEQNRKIDHVLFFEIPDQVILDRLARRRDIEGRADDDPKSVATRLAAYRAQTAPVLEYYQKQGNVRMIDAVGSVDEIAQRVQKVLGG